MEGLALLGKSLAGLAGPWQVLYALGATLLFSDYGRGWTIVKGLTGASAQMPD